MLETSLLKALLLEALLQIDSQNSQAWTLLGQCHAENDEDKKAIICLLHAKETDPYNLDSLLALGTCYVNEINPIGALDSLKAWVLHNPKYIFSNFYKPF